MIRVIKNLILEFSDNPYRCEYITKKGTRCSRKNKIKGCCSQHNQIKQFKIINNLPSQETLIKKFERSKKIIFAQLNELKKINIQGLDNRELRFPIRNILCAISLYVSDVQIPYFKNSERLIKYVKESVLKFRFNEEKSHIPDLIQRNLERIIYHFIISKRFDSLF